jgi:hypothetical protein
VMSVNGSFEEPLGLDRVDGRLDDTVECVAAGAGVQCNCLGSDQPDRPVTALKVRSRRLSS